MYRYSCPHIYTQIEKTNPIFKTWFVQLKISTARFTNTVFREIIELAVPKPACVDSLNYSNNTAFFVK